MIKNIFGGRTHSASEEASRAFTDEALIKKFTANPDFPYLISFPRTGSHWLRMLMELYFEKPSLVRAFYFKDATDFNCYHHHDQDLDVERRNVMYLYRQPVPTVFSQMNYYREDLNDTSRIIFWSNLYGRHLEKWLLNEKFTTKKTVVRYENLKKDINAEFAAICEHLSEPFNKENLSHVAANVSKEKLKEKTAHDEQVVNLSSDYELERKTFEHQHSALIWSTIDTVNPRLRQFFA